MTDDPIAVAGLPKSIRDVAETLGLPLVLNVIQHFGGQEIKFPKFLKEDHPVYRALGKDDATALCSFLSGEMIYVPHMRKRRSIRMDVLALEDAGRERREIASILGVSQRHVRRMANKAPPAAQLSLFDFD